MSDKLYNVTEAKHYRILILTHVNGDPGGDLRLAMVYVLHFTLSFWGLWWEQLCYPSSVFAFFNKLSKFL
jgi:hypothetical protein